MKGNRDRRELESFAPFRADEIVETPFKDKDTGDRLYTYYPTFSGRLRVARDAFTDLKIRTRVIKAELRVAAIVQAFTEGTPRGLQTPGVVTGCGIGTADKTGDGRLLDSLLELAETRAIGRALRSMGIGSDMAGAEEMDRAGINDEVRRARDSDDNAHRERKNDRDRGGPFGGGADDKPAERKPAGGSPKADLGTRLMKLAKDDKKLAADMLLFVVARDSLGQLSEFEVRCANAALDVIAKCAGDGKAAKRWVYEVMQLPWFDKMTEPELKEALAHMKDGGSKEDAGGPDDAPNPF